MLSHASKANTSASIIEDEQLINHVDSSDVKFTVDVEEIIIEDDDDYCDVEYNKKRTRSFRTRFLSENTTATTSAIKCDNTTNINNNTLDEVPPHHISGSIASNVSHLDSDTNRKDFQPHCCKYRFVRTIGKGNFAKVKLAIHILTGSEVAIKIIDKTHLNQKSLSKLLREVRIMKMLNHPNIVRLYEVMETEKTLYLVLEYASGGEVFDYLVAHGKMKEKEAREKFRQIVSAIEYCHQKKIVHRDLKPENLLLDGDMNIKIADFGFSNEFSPGHTLDTFCGSPPYAAPELFLGLKYMGPEIDVWSLGVILYTLVSGSLPFDAVNLRDLHERILRCRYRVPYYMSNDCEGILKKMLVPDSRIRKKMEDVMSDPWMNIGYESSQQLRPYIEPEGYMTDTFRVAMLMQLGFSHDDIEASLSSDRFDNITATYILLEERQKMLRLEEAKNLIIERQSSMLCRNYLNKKCEFGRNKSISLTTADNNDAMFDKTDQLYSTPKRDSQATTAVLLRQLTKNTNSASQKMIMTSAYAAGFANKPCYNNKCPPRVGRMNYHKMSPTTSVQEHNGPNNHINLLHLNQSRNVKRIPDGSDEPPIPGVLDRFPFSQSCHGNNGSTIPVHETTDNITIQNTVDDDSLGNKFFNNSIFSGISPFFRNIFGAKPKIQLHTINEAVPSSNKTGQLNILEEEDEINNSNHCDIVTVQNDKKCTWTTNKPRILRFTFSMETTSSDSADDMILIICKLLQRLRLNHRRIDRFFIVCTTCHDIEFEIEVCSLPRLSLNGVRLKRISGSSIGFKNIASKITSLLHFTN